MQAIILDPPYIELLLNFSSYYLLRVELSISISYISSLSSISIFITT